jgi:hypothetical protein
MNCNVRRVRHCAADHAGSAARLPPPAPDPLFALPRDMGAAWRGLVAAGFENAIENRPAIDYTIGMGLLARGFGMGLLARGHWREAADRRH